MKALLCAVVAGLFPSIVAATPPPPQPRILSIRPAASTPGGVIQLHGAYITTEGPCTPADCVTVSFGDVRVPAEIISSTEIRVTVPQAIAGNTAQRLNGVVDIIVRVAGKQPFVLPDAFTIVTREEDAYEPIILPLLFEGTRPGRFGSVWSSDVVIRNISTEPVDLLLARDYPPGETPDMRVTIPAESTLRTLPPVMNQHRPISSIINVQLPPYELHGRILHVLRSDAAKLQITQRVRSGSQADQELELPVIREKDLATHQELLDVPVTSDARLLLRAYSPRFGGTRMRIFDSETDQLLADEYFSLEVPRSRILFNENPAYGEFAGIESLVAGRAERIRIELTFPNPIYGFVTITDNETQRVRVVTPQ